MASAMASQSDWVTAVGSKFILGGALVFASLIAALMFAAAFADAELSCKGAHQVTLPAPGYRLPSGEFVTQC